LGLLVLASAWGVDALLARNAGPVNLHRDSGKEVADENSEDPPDPQRILDKMGDVSDGFKAKVKERAEEWVKRMQEGEEKPLMDKINVLRAELCWSRGNLMKHKACLEFLGLHCIESSTGEGICTEFRDKVVSECHDPDTAVDLRELKCDIAEVFEHALPQEEDTDGDGHINSEDALPLNPEEWEDTDHDRIGNKADIDIDGDQVLNEPDLDPKDPSVGAGPAPSPMAAAPAPVPAPTSTVASSSSATTTETTEAPKPPPPAEKGEWKFDFNKVERPLPTHGYHGPLVEHDDGDTWTGDWRKEWPTGHESEKQAIARICEDFPENEWCKRQGHGR